MTKITAEMTEFQAQIGTEITVIFLYLMIYLLNKEIHFPLFHSQKMTS